MNYHLLNNSSREYVEQNAETEKLIEKNIKNVGLN